MQSHGMKLLANNFCADINTREGLELTGYWVNKAFVTYKYNMQLSNFVGWLAIVLKCFCFMNNTTNRWLWHMWDRMNFKNWLHPIKIPCLNWQPAWLDVIFHAPVVKGLKTNELKDEEVWTNNFVPTVCWSLPCLWDQSGGGVACANMVTVESSQWELYSAPLSWSFLGYRGHQWCHHGAVCCW